MLSETLRVKGTAKTRSIKITASTLQKNPLILLEILKKSNCEALL